MIHFKNIHRVIAYNLNRMLVYTKFRNVVTRFKVVKVYTLRLTENRDEF